MLNRIVNKVLDFFWPEDEVIEKSDYGRIVKNGFLEIIEADIASTEEIIKGVDVSVKEQVADILMAIEENDQAIDKSEDGEEEDFLFNKIYLKQQLEDLSERSIIVKSSLFKKIDDLKKAHLEITEKDINIQEAEDSKYTIRLDSTPDLKNIVKPDDEPVRLFQDYLDTISEVLANPKKIYDTGDTPEPVPLEYQKYMQFSIGRDRESMPQIKKKNIDEAVIHFAQKSPNTKVKKKLIPLSKLRPAQSELNDDKIRGMIERGDIDINKEIFIVSKENYLVDSHHRWAVLLEKHKDDGEAPLVTVYKINLDINELLRRFNLLKISGKKDIEDNVKKSEEGENRLSDTAKEGSNS